MYLNFGCLTFFIYFMQPKSRIGRSKFAP